MYVNINSALESMFADIFFLLFSLELFSSIIYNSALCTKLGIVLIV